MVAPSGDLYIFLSVSGHRFFRRDGPDLHCQVPIPAGCLVAHTPGTTKPWTTISKGGKTFCRFDEKQTDWKTKITGTCGRCSTAHCSVQFIVRFDCNPH